MSAEVTTCAASRAHCEGCDWLGPVRATEVEADRDADLHDDYYHAEAQS